MSQGDSAEEKLVEEMYEVLSRLTGHIVRYQASGDRHAEHECKMNFAHGLITRIGKAYADGELVAIAKGRLDLRDGKLYLENELLVNVIGIYADGHITICISKEREVARRTILDQIFVGGTGEKEE